VIKIKDRDKLEFYIAKYDLQNIFSVDMKKFMELFLFNKNEYICKIDEKIEYIYFFVDGKAKVYTMLGNGKSLLVSFYKPLMIIGDVECIHLNAASSNVQVIEDTYCIAIEFDKIQKYALEDAKFLRYMNESLGKKLIRLSKYSSINLLYPLENRLASYLLAVTPPSNEQISSSLDKDCNLTEMAELLGTSYRHLLRTLNKLCENGCIVKNRDSYEIRDRARLEELSGEGY
jgi:CRP-like cAMP-binding protein